MGMGGFGYGQMISGAITGGISAYGESVQKEEQHRFNKSIARFNAQMARNAALEAAQEEEHVTQLRRRDAELSRINASIASTTAERKREDVRREGRRFVSSMRASAGASGVAVDEGSSLWAQLESVRLAEYDATVAGFGAEMEAFKSTDDAKMLDHEADVHAQKAQYIRDFGIEQAGALYDAQAKYYKNWATYEQDSRVGFVVAGVIGGAMGQTQTNPSAQAPEGIRSYAYDDQGDGRGSAMDQYRRGERDNAIYEREDHPRSTFGDSDQSSESSFKISEEF